jgi:hypothetical protein
VERGTYTAPAAEHPGVRYQGSLTTPEQWEEIKHFWTGWGEELADGEADVDTAR